MPGLRPLPGSSNDDGLGLASEEIATEVEALLITQPDTAPETGGNLNGALDPSVSPPSLPLVNPGAAGDGPRGSDGMIPSNISNNKALNSKHTGAPYNSPSNI
ncbi:hypothetical protein EKO04_007739 [Ascochyta lentis]|uniref:Uncharacterized protein n=1 Tax=Ascochyta lentis TaxID=205686 RepID=A0A8H7MF24_9PLEO|nr:hypothetical protein EKO04_007739 [Ascochyta lentis]